LVVTAGNQPYWYNGLVLLAPQPDLSLDGVVEQLPEGSSMQFPQNDLNETTAQDLRGPYLELLRNNIDIDLIRRTTLTVFVDPMHGTAASYIPAAIGDGGQTKAIEINREVDPLFGRSTPQPVGAPLMRLRKLVRESDSNVGLALSADGSALSAVDKSGETVTIFDLTLVLAAHLSRQHRQRGIVVVPEASEALPGLQQWEDSLGLKVEQSKQPLERMTEIINRDRSALVIGSSAQGEVIVGDFRSSPDALYAGLLVMELLARSGGNLRTLIDELHTALRGKG
jgi:phosphomannomutase